MATAGGEESSSAGTGAGVPTASVSNSEVHLLLDRLELPNLGQRIYYTCIDVSRHLLACGANTGSVYLFERRESYSSNATHKLNLVETTASVGEPVTRVSFSRDGKKLALSSSSGTIRIVKLNLGSLRQKQEVTQTNTVHKGSTVTSLKWDYGGKRLFSGDTKGVVSSIILSDNKVTSLFSKPEIYYRGESPIVQLDFQVFDAVQWVLISTRKRCIVFELEADSVGSSGGDKTSIVKPKQVGRKLRDGPFGACFCEPEDQKVSTLMKSLTAEQDKKAAAAGQGDAVGPQASKSPFFIYAARPGRRVWLANGLSQTVLCTLKPTLEMKQTCFLLETESDPTEKPSLDFGRVMRFRSSLGGDFSKEAKALLLSWNSSTIFLINTDMPVFTGARVLQWHIDLGEIHDLALSGSSCSENNAAFYVLHGKQRALSRVIALETVPFLHSQYLSRMPLDWCLKSCVEHEINNRVVLQKIHRRLQSELPEDRAEEDEGGEENSAEDSAIVQNFLDLMRRAKDTEKVVAPYEIQNSLPFRSPQSSVEILKRVSDGIQDLSSFAEDADPTKTSEESQKESIALFKKILEDVVARWKDSNGEDGTSTDNANARRYYRIKYMAHKADMPVELPSEIPVKVENQDDLVKWGEEIVKFIQQSHSKIGEDTFEDAKVASRVAASRIETAASTPASTGSKKSKKKKKKGGSTEGGTAKAKKKKGGRERLVSIGDLEDGGLPAPRRVSAVKKKKQKKKSAKIEDVIDSAQGALSRTVSGASKAVESFKADLLFPEAQSSSQILDANDKAAGQGGDNSRTADTAAEDLALQRRPASKPWQQIRQKKREEFDVSEVDKLDQYVQNVRKSVADDSVQSKIKSGTSSLVNWFASATATVPVTLKAKEGHTLSDLRSKRTAHVVYEKGDGFEKIKMMNRSSTDKKTAGKAFPDPMLTRIVYDYTLVHLQRGQLVSAEPVLGSFVKSFDPSKEKTVSGAEVVKDTIPEGEGADQGDEQGGAQDLESTLEEIPMDRQLTDSERAKTVELATIYFELHCANQNNNGGQGITTVDGKYLLPWDDEQLISFFGTYGNFLDFDRVLITVMKRKSSGLFDALQPHLVDYTGGSSHRLFTAALNQDDNDRLFAALFHWQSTFYSTLEDASPIPPLSCLCQPTVLLRLVEHDEKKTISLLLSWFQWLSPWLIFLLLGDNTAYEGGKLSTSKWKSWYNSLLQQLFSHGAVDATGTDCRDNALLLKSWLELEMDAKNDSTVERIIMNTDCDSNWVRKFCSKRSYLPALMYLMSDASKKVGVLKSSELTKNSSKKPNFNRKTLVREIEKSANIAIDIIIKCIEENKSFLKALFAMVSAHSPSSLDAMLRKFMKLEVAVADEMFILAFGGIVQSIGAKPSFALIEAFSEDEREYIPPEVYKIIMTAHSNKEEQRKAIDGALSTLDNYLWKKKDTVLAPQIRAIKDAEYEYRYGKNKDLSHLPAGIQNFIKSGGQDTEGLMNLDKDFHRFYEDEGCHWGVATSLQRRSGGGKDGSAGGTGGTAESEYIGRDLCPRCGTGYSKGDRILFYKCGHACHNECAKEKVCTICLASFAAMG